MKRQLLIRLIASILAIFTLSSTLQSQSGWEEVYSGDNMFMRDICFVEGGDGLWQTGWAISFEGDIIKTTDGGDTWIEIGQSISSALAGISFADEDTGLIATLDNKILKSTDGGITWSTVYNGSVNFDMVAMKDANKAVAIGTSKLYTSDGGTTWNTGTGGSDYWYLDYASNDTYYGVYLGGSLGESIDGGQTWTDIESLGSMAFMTEWLNDAVGMFAGDLSKMKVTHDGGSSWISNTLGNGQDVINCGGFFDGDTIYAAGSSGDIFKSTDGGVNWSTDTSFATGVFMPRALAVTGMNEIFTCGSNSSSEGLIWRKIGAPPIDADFEASETVICVGSSIDFTDLSVGPIDSWSWEFEGGTPATSTDQHPTATYNATGTFNVKLFVTVGALADSLTKVDYIEVVDLPDQAGTPEGDDVVCTDQSYVYTINAVEFGHDYEWELNPTNAGTLTWEDITAFLAVADDWTGDFTLRARAGNVCGDGDWSDNFEGTVFQSPSEFILEGGGGFCLNSDGVEITLDGSETGVSYELYLDSEATGITAEGTGSEISFGLVTDEGYYTAIGSNDNCVLMMLNQVQVWLEFPPLEPATPVGPEVVCEETSSDYTSDGSDDADSYEWVLTPEEAGSITFDGLEATVEWSTEFSGQAYVSLYGINDCGNGNPSNELEVSVGAPNPEVSGEALVCDWSDEVYEVAENDGSNYTWEVSGGTILEGQGTYMITVSWEGEGNGTLSVEEETADGCSGSSEEFEVMIDDCTSIQDNETEHLVGVHPNPAKSKVTIHTDLFVHQIALFSLSGELLQNKMLNDQHLIIDISWLDPGIYLLKIDTDQGTVTKKLIVE